MITRIHVNKLDDTAPMTAEDIQKLLAVLSYHEGDIGNILPKGEVVSRFHLEKKEGEDHYSLNAYRENGKILFHIDSRDLDKIPTSSSEGFKIVSFYEVNIHYYFTDKKRTMHFTDGVKDMGVEYGAPAVPFFRNRADISQLLLRDE